MNLTNFSFEIAFHSRVTNMATVRYCGVTSDFCNSHITFTQHYTFLTRTTYMYTDIGPDLFAVWLCYTRMEWVIDWSTM